MRFPPLMHTWFAVACTVLTSTAFSSESRFYPEPNPKPLEVGEEKFREGYLSLRDLEGLHVDLTLLTAAGKNKNIILPDALAQQVRDKIESAGLFFLTKEETQVTPGQPVMNLWPAYEDEYPKECGNNIKAECATPIRCESRLWVSFEQSASLLRQPENQYRLNTWGDGDKSSLCGDKRGQWMAEAVLNKIDYFITDYKKAQQDTAPVVVAKTSDVPEHCSQSWVTHLNVFATNESTINTHVKPIFDRLTRVAERCNTYNYIIETHADHQTESSFDKLLTEARARSIKDYLLSKGMPYHRLKMRPLGDSDPAAPGSTAADKKKNRRIIIKPVKLEEFRNAELDF